MLLPNELNLRRLLASPGAVVSLAALLLAVATPAHASDAPTCERLVFPVALAPDQPAELEVAGWLCARGGVEGKTVQLLVHGATYDHQMWDPPYRPERYSYVRAATQAGYATVSLDRLGHGESSRVDGHLLDVHIGAFALEQVVQALRSGELVTESFDAVRAEKVVLVGSSLGANMSWLMAATYKSVDGLILSGSSHSFSTGMNVVRQMAWPVERDPDFRGETFPDGYLTTRKGTRGALFFWNPNAERDAVALDDALRQTVTVAENISVLDTLFGVAREVDVPTYITVGDHDWLFCDMPSCTATGSLDNELENWGPDACAELLIMPDAGHTLTLHKNAPDYFGELLAWADRRVGADVDSDPSQPCRQ